MGKKHKYITVSTVLDESFNLYFKNFLKFVTPVACVYIPMVLFIMMPIISMSMRNPAYQENLSPESLSLMGVSVLFGLVTIPLYYIVIKIISNAYTDHVEEYKPLIKIALRRFFSFWWMNILMVLMIWLGAILLIFPMFIFMTALSLSHMAFVLEEKGPVKSLKRSWALTKGFKWKIFAIYFLVMMILESVMMIIMAVGMGSIVGIATAMSVGFDSMNAATVMIGVVYSVIMTVLVPLFPVFTVVIYYNLLKEREGFETVSLASSFLEGHQDQEPVK